MVLWLCGAWGGQVAPEPQGASQPASRNVVTLPVRQKHFFFSPIQNGICLRGCGDLILPEHGITRPPLCTGRGSGRAESGRGVWLAGPWGPEQEWALCPSAPFVPDVPTPSVSPETSLGARGLFEQPPGVALPGIGDRDAEIQPARWDERRGDRWLVLRGQVRAVVDLGAQELYYGGAASSLWPQEVKSLPVASGVCRLGPHRWPGALSEAGGPPLLQDFRFSLRTPPPASV